MWPGYYVLLFLRMLLEMPELEVLTSFPTAESGILDRKQKGRKEQKRGDSFIFRQRKIQKKERKGDMNYKNIKENEYSYL